MRKLFLDSFTEKDIAKELKISKDMAHYLRFKLIQKGEIVRIARGVYRFGKKELITIPHSIEYIRDGLLKLKKRFVFTGLSVLGKYWQNDNIYLLYVEKNNSNLFEKTIEKLKTNYVVLIEPTKREIDLLRDKANVKDIIVIRENSYFYSSTQNIASVESAFIDLFFEITREKLPLENKLQEVLGKLIGKLNVSTLLKYANDRGIKKEVVAMLKNFENIPRRLLR